MQASGKQTRDVRQRENKPQCTRVPRTEAGSPAARVQSALAEGPLGRQAVCLRVGLLPPLPAWCQPPGANWAALGRNLLCHHLSPWLSEESTHAGTSIPRSSDSIDRPPTFSHRAQRIQLLSQLPASPPQGPPISPPQGPHTLPT